MASEAHESPQAPGIPTSFEDLVEEGAELPRDDIEKIRHLLSLTPTERLHRAQSLIRQMQELANQVRGGVPPRRS